MFLPDLVLFGLSALLTTTMTGQKGVVEALQRHGLRLLRAPRRRERALLDEAGSSEGGRASRFAEKLCSLWGRSFRSDVKCLAIFGASTPEATAVIPSEARDSLFARQVGRPIESRQNDCESRPTQDRIPHAASGIAARSRAHLRNIVEELAKRHGMERLPEV